VALAILVGGIDVGYTLVERAGEGFESLVLLLVLEEANASAEGEDGNARAGFAEDAAGESGLAGVGREGGGGDSSSGGGSEEFASGDAHEIIFR
jgi:hypothetical protein